MNCHILIVDDSPILRASIKKSALMAGLDADHIHEAGNGREALEVMDDVWIDLVLLDLNMPVMNGEEFLRVKNKWPENREVPVIIVSTESNKERLAQLAHLGVYDRLHKPFEPEKLCKLLSKLLGIHA